MVDFVSFDTRAAAWPLARPAVPVTPAVGVWPGAQVNDENATRGRFASEAPRTADPRNGEFFQPNAASQQSGESVRPRQSAPFTAQQLAQDSETAPELRPSRATAMAAYLKTRDSHIQILRSIQALDLRV